MRIEGTDIDTAFRMIYSSEFYERLTAAPSTVHEYSDYWAYDWIARENGIKPKPPVECRKTGIDPNNVVAACVLFEEIRKDMNADPAMLALRFSKLGIFKGLLTSSMSPDGARKRLSTIKDGERGKPLGLKREEGGMRALPSSR